jgi:soluble lytic murein transglycosylase-like protein
MSASVDRTGRRPRGAAHAAFAAALIGLCLTGLCLVRLGPSGLVLVAMRPAIAQSNIAGEGGSRATTSALPDPEADPSIPPPPAFRPIIAKPLAPADLPPPSVFAARSPLRTASLAATADPGRRGDASGYGAIVEREALALGVPPELADAVMAVESSYNPATVGASGEIGLMQLMPGTAAMLGFTGTSAELAVPETNIHYGVMYLAAAWQLAGQDICTATMKYRAGHGETRFSYLSVDYCIRVRAHLAARGFPVTGTVPLPTFGQPAGAGSRGRLPLDRGTGRLDLDALNARLRELTDKVAVRTLH